MKILLMIFALFWAAPLLVSSEITAADSVGLKQQLATASLRLADSYFQNKHYREALKNYRLAAKNDPFNGSAWFGLGNCYYATGQNKLALECFEKAGNVDFFTDRKEEAIEAFWKVFQMDPANQKVNSFLEYADAKSYRKAEKLFEKKKYREAIAAYKVAIKFDPLNGKIWHDMGVASLQAGKSDDAFQAFRKSAYAYFFACERICAVDALHDALKLMPNNVELLEFLHQLEPVTKTVVP